MWISRLRVTGGFLKGLDISFSKGLNVVVGPRGTGKTTILELIRHATGAAHADQAGGVERQKFLKAVLGSGEVVLDVEAVDGGRHLVVDSQGGGRRSGLSHAVLVLGQNELENIASDSASRLNLLDLRTGYTSDSQNLTTSEVVAELTAELFDLRVEINLREDETKKRQRIMSDAIFLFPKKRRLLGAPLRSWLLSELCLRKWREELRRPAGLLIRPIEPER